MDCSVASCPHHTAGPAACALVAPPPPHPLAATGLSPRPGSLVVASLEIGRALADRGRATFRAQGTCMYPCVQPGDVLHLESRPLDQVAVGEIVVVRRGDCLFGHRAIATGAADGRPYLVTRPDRSQQGSDGPAYGEDVLGVVTAIERHGRRMDTRPQPLRPGPAIRVALWEWWNWRARERLIRLVGRLQRTALYHRLARAGLALTRRPTSCVVRIPLRPGQTHDVYRQVSPAEFDVSQPTWQGRAVTGWTLALYLGAGRTPAAWVTLAWRPPECPQGGGWWVEERHTRARYRGAGLEETLIRQVEEILARGGATLQGSQ